jgi:putative tryptophan/tyrosine transport system substrate-binding protein
VSVIVASGGSVSALAAKAATVTIPIVFMTGGDPVQAGLVVSLNRPGGNITGIGSMNAGLAAKRLGLLLELLPGAARFAVLVNPNTPLAESVITDVRAAASADWAQIEVFAAGTNRDIGTTFASLVQLELDPCGGPGIASATPRLPWPRAPVSCLLAPGPATGFHRQPTRAESFFPIFPFLLSL